MEEGEGETRRRGEWEIVSFRREKAGGEQQIAKFNPIRSIDIENGDRCAGGRCATNESRSVPMEMTRPALPPRIEKCEDLSGYRIDAAQITRLREIAVEARPCKIALGIRSAVLSGNDMLDVKREEREMCSCSRQYSHRCAARVRTSARVDAFMRADGDERGSAALSPGGLQSIHRQKRRSRIRPAPLWSIRLRCTCERACSRELAPSRPP